MKEIILTALLGIVAWFLCTKNIEVRAILQEKLVSYGYTPSDEVLNFMAIYLPLILLALIVLYFVFPKFWQLVHPIHSKLTSLIQFRSPLVLKAGKKAVLPTANKAAPSMFSDDEKYLLVLLVKARDQHVIMGESHLKFALKTIFSMSDASINLLIKRSESKNFIIHHKMMVDDDYFSANEYYYTQIHDKDNEFIWHELLPDDLKRFDNKNRLI